MIQSSALSYMLIILFFTISIIVSRGFGENSSEFFLSGGIFPVCLLGVSLVKVHLLKNSKVIACNLQKSKNNFKII